MQDITQLIKREAALFDFFNKFEADGLPRIASFRYNKTTGASGTKIRYSRSYEMVTMAVQAPRTIEVREESDRHTTIDLQSDNLIRTIYNDASSSRQVIHLKLKLLTHYRPSFSKNGSTSITLRKTAMIHPISDKSSIITSSKTRVFLNVICKHDQAHSPVSGWYDTSEAL